MRKLKVSKIWISAFLLAVLAGGCGDPDKQPVTPGPLTPPTVTSVTPAAGSTLTCFNTGTPITATFSKAMNPATINTSTFTLMGAGGASISGAVTYAAATNTATFTPSSALATNTAFTATITTGAADTFGNPLAANFVWMFTSAPPCPPPTVIAVTPPNGSTLVCPNTPVITATFSKPMNPATINPSTFTLSTGGTSVAGAVTYNVATHIATFTPSAPLVASTTYTATITTGVTDTFGIPLAANFVWTFTTSPVCAPPPPPPSPLGTACSFGILAGSTVTNVVSVGTTVSGDVGVWPGTAITGFPPGTITGAFHAGDAVAMTAQGDLTTAYNNAGTAAGGTFGTGTGTGTVLPADIGGQTLAPGVYRTTSAQPSLGITGDLTLSGPATGVWIFQIGSTLTTAAGTTGVVPNSRVILTGGALSKNVFWQVGSSATLGTSSIFAGNIMAQASVTLTTGATLNGRALARTGAVTLDTNTVVVPSCP